MCIYIFFLQLQKSASRNSESSQTVHTNHEASSRGGGVREVHSSPDHSASMAQILQVKVRKIPNKMWTNLIYTKKNPKPAKPLCFDIIWLTDLRPVHELSPPPPLPQFPPCLPPHSQYCIDIWLICHIPLNF